MRLHEVPVPTLLLVMVLLLVPGVPGPASAQAPPPLGDTFDGPVIDKTNGFVGAGGGFPVAGTSLAVLLPATLPTGNYQVRVIGLTSAGQLFGTFSDAVTVVVQ